MPRLPLFLLPFSEVVVKDVTPSLHGALHTLRAVASESKVPKQLLPTVGVQLPHRPIQAHAKAHSWRPAATPSSKQVDSGPRSAHTWRPAATPASKQLFRAVFGNVKNHQRKRHISIGNKMSPGAPTSHGMTSPPRGFAGVCYGFDGSAVADCQRRLGKFLFTCSCGGMKELRCRRFGVPLSRFTFTSLTAHQEPLMGLLLLRMRPISIQSVV